MEMKSYCNIAGHMTKMAAEPIYGKTPFKNLLWYQWIDIHDTCYVTLGASCP